jgi:uncharacterized protein YgiM (DUF1202 family)
MVRLLLITITVFSIVFTFSPAQAQNNNNTLTATVRAAVLNVRNGPNLGNTALEHIKLGTVVTVLGRNNTGTWLEVRTSQGAVGWVAALWVKLSAGSAMNVPLVTPNTPVQPATSANSQITATVHTLRLNLREGAGTTATRILMLQKGDVVTVLGRNSGGTWIKVQTSQGKQGWVFVHLVTLSGSTVMNLAIVS